MKPLYALLIKLQSHSINIASAYYEITETMEELEDEEAKVSMEIRFGQWLKDVNVVESVYLDPRYREILLPEDVEKARNSIKVRINDNLDAP